MTTKERDQLLITPLADYDPLVGRWLWLLTDSRQRTLEALAGMAESALDWRPDEGANTIGTLLYHIVAIELDWLYVELLEQPDYSAAVAGLLPYDVRDAAGRLTPVYGESLTSHLARLAASRQLLLDELRSLTAAELYHVRRFEPYDVTPEWVLYHLLEHETGHRGEIGELRRQAERSRC
ncbi:MAG: DinB family protein [Caldilinea sp. CFX5]|nr:DinB family protein [Caldilinea sp. CFX5]